MKRMYFVGVSTGESSIMRLFPEWADVLGLRAELVGIDLPLGAPAAAVRQALDTIIADPIAVGALVTTHKVSVFTHASNIFDDLDHWASICGEVSCLAKRDGRVQGWAKDPITSWDSFLEIVTPDYFDSHPGSEVLCLGAGGSGAAFTSRLLTIDSPPRRIILTNRSPERLDVVRGIHEQIGADVPVTYQPVSGPDVTNAMVTGLTPGSIVVNATGLGKDRPGSPITDDVVFPEDGVVWDFNYRGTLELLAQARRQETERGLLIEDGWRYFLRGWSEHISEVFGLELSPVQFDSLAAVAESIRPGC